MEAHLSPLHLQVPPEGISLSVEKIPAIEVQWKGKEVPLQIAWPREPLPVRLEMKPGESGPFPSPAPSATAGGSNSSDVALIQTLRGEVTDQKQQLERDAQLLQELSKQLADGKVSKEVNDRLIELQKKIGQTPPDPATQLYEAKMHWVYWIFFWLVLSGILGGLSIICLEHLQELRKNRLELIKLETALKSIPGWEEWPYSPCSSTKIEDWKKGEKLSATIRDRNSRLAFWSGEGVWIFLPPILIGIIAALMVPAVIFVIPGARLQDAEHDPFTLVTICSISFVAAMLGELFIEVSLHGFRAFLKRWADAKR